MTNRVLVVGGTGYLGYRIAKQLESRGYSVSVAGRTPIKNIKFPFLHMDICEPHIDTISEFNFDCVINCTGQQTTPINDCADQNTIGIIRLLSLLSESRTPRFIHISSFAIFGDNQQKTPESDPIPTSTYGTLKFASERLVRALAANPLVIRPTNLYSIDAPAGVFAYLVRQFEKGEFALQFDSDISAPKFFLHVDKAAADVVDLMESSTCEVCHLIGEDHISISNLINVFEQIHNVKYTVTSTHGDPAKIDSPS